MILQMSLSTEICVNTSSVFVRSVMPSFLDELCPAEIVDAMFAKWTTPVDGTTFGDDLLFWSTVQCSPLLILILQGRILLSTSAIS